jgi:hypothetical protein
VRWSVFAALFVGALVAVAPAPARAGEVRRVEAVGAVALDHTTTKPRIPRDAALHEGIAEGVKRVALDLVADLEPMSGEEILGDILGDDPLVYVTRYRILEDRGVRPALFVDDPEAENEYVVVVEVQVDVDRVRRRLVEGGLLAPAPAGEGHRLSLQVSVDGITSYGAYLAVIEALEAEGGARSAMPVEASPGRVTFEVDGALDGPALLSALLEARRPDLRITPLGSDEQRVAFLVDWQPPAPADGSPAGGAPD